MNWRLWRCAIFIIPVLPSLGEVRLFGELGFGGLGVPGAVNPLWITVENGDAAPLIGKILVRGRIGSFRGEADRTLVAPLALAPLGRARFLIPWPLEAGERVLRIAIQVGEKTAAEATVPIEFAPVGLTVSVGPPRAPPTPMIVISPEDLPKDPILLTPFSILYINQELPPAAQAGLAAWVGFLGGSTVPEPDVPKIYPPSYSDLRALVLRHPFAQLPLGPMALALVLYLVGIGFALPPLARTGRPLPILLLLIPSIGLSLLYPVFYDVGENYITVNWQIIRSDIPSFIMEWSGIVAKREWGWWGEGMWMEAVLVGEEWGGRDMGWEVRPDGVYTMLTLQPGKERLMWRLSPAQPKQEIMGETFWMEDGRLLRELDGRRFTSSQLFQVVSPAFRPLLQAVTPFLEPGDRVILAEKLNRTGGGKIYRYILWWDRHG